MKALYNGIELPDINEVWTDKATYPYAAIDINGCLRISKSINFYDGYNMDGTFSGSFVNFLEYESFNVSSNGNEWKAWKSGTGSAIDVRLVAWANFDVLDYEGNLVLKASEPIPTGYAIISRADYKAACDAIRAKTGKNSSITSEKLKSEITDNLFAFNIHYGAVAPKDTSKLWVRAEAELAQTRVSSDISGSGDCTVKTLDTTIPIAASDMGICAVGTKIYLFGGYNWTKGSLNSINVFDTETDSIITLDTTLPFAAFGIAAVAVGTKIYLFGGEDQYGNAFKEICVFDTVTNSISTLSVTLPQETWSIRACAMDTKIYLFGGIVSVGDRGQVDDVDTISVFDTETNSIVTLSEKMPVDTSSMGVGAVGTKIYLIGGNKTVARMVYEFDTETNTIRYLGVRLPVSTEYPVAGTIGTKVYLIGGSDSYEGVIHDTIYVYDTEENEITTLSSTVPKLVGCAGCAVGTQIYRFGGNNNTEGYSTSIIKVNPTSMVVVPSLEENIFQLMDVVELGISGVYKVDAIGESEKLKAYLYNKTTGEWELVTHAGEWIIIRDATVTEDGEKQKTCTVCGFVEHEVIHATGSEGLSYELLEDGTYRVSKGTSTDTEIHIPKYHNDWYVSAVAGHGFSGSSAVTSISIPDSVTDIGISAFYNCVALEEVNIPVGVNRISSNMFENCYSLTSISLPYSVTNIDKYAFRGCRALEEILIPAGVVDIGTNRLFGSCNSLESIVVAEGNIKYHSEGNCVIEKATNTLVCGCKASVIPDGVITIGEKAFSECPITNIIIPEGVKHIGVGAFDDCYLLESIFIPASVTSLREYFLGGHCRSLKNIVVSTDSSKFESIDGDLYNNSASSLVRYAIGKTDTSFVIPNSVTRIEVGAFECSCNLTSVTIPDSVTDIRLYAFGACDALERVIFEGTPNFIGYQTSGPASAFASCSNLIDIYVPWAEGEVAGAPWGATNATIHYNHTHTQVATQAVPPTCTETGLTEGSCCEVCGAIIVAQEVIEALGHSYGDWIVTKDATVTEDGEKYRVCSRCGEVEYGIVHATGSEGLNYELLRDGTYSVDKGTCTDAEIYIPEYYNEGKVSAIHQSAFYGDDIVSVTIPKSVTYIQSSAFGNCTGLTSLTVEEGNTAYYSEGDCIIETNTGMLVVGCNSSVIPEGVMSIDSFAFSDCIGLTSVTIPEGVTRIGMDAFEDCTGLTSVTIPNSVTYIGQDAFNGCTALTSVEIPGSLTNIGFQVFNDCTGLTSVTLSEGLVSIGSNAFSGCTGLTSVTIPNSVTTINNSAFYECTSLASINIPDSVTAVGRNAFAYTAYFNDLEHWTGDALYVDNCLINVKQTITGDYSIIDGTRLLSAYAFDKCKELTSVTIPGSVTIIGNYAFNDCTGLTDIIISEGVTTIGYNAFNRCIGLTSVTIPNSVTKLPSGIFSGCAGLTSIEIPDSVTSIGGSAFCECTGLTRVTIGINVAILGSYAFYGCTGLTSIIIPDSVISIEEYAFAYCSELSSVIIGNGVTSIGAYAFQFCEGVTSITLPDSVTSIDEHAFEYSSVTTINVPWAEGEVADAPWGATNATINYNYTDSES